jgi:predicted GNAT family N-acyltransferase
MISVETANSSNDLKTVFAIRNDVFVIEQNVDKREEYDEFETSSTHYLAMYNGIPVGTCRFRNTDKGIKLERFAVLKEGRGKGVGEALVMQCLKDVDTRLNIYLHAQIQVVDFYSKYGFVKEGPEFVEADIRHYKMTYKPT